MTGFRSSSVEPSTADVVHAVMRSAETPLTFDDIFSRVTARQAVRTRDPRATVRGALSQGPQLIALGDGRFGYLPRLLQGSVVRWPLDARDLAQGPLPFPDDVRHALFPDFFEIDKRKLHRPAKLHLPTGEVPTIELAHLGGFAWGVRNPPTSLGRFLVDAAANRGDDMVVRVLDAEAGEFEARLERAAERDEVALARGNRELIASAHAYLVSNRSPVVAIWEILDALLARGAYRADVPPRPLEELLRSDQRFENAGDGGWTLAAERHSRPRPTPSPRRELAAALRADLLDLLPARSTQRSAAAALLDALLDTQAEDRRAVTIRRRRPGKARLYQLKVTLRGIKPPVWRRLLVPSDTTLDRLHEILQSAMGWFDLHLHAFEAEGIEYGLPGDEFDAPIEDEQKMTLAQVAPTVGARLVYRYDFGDDWEHDVRLEKILPHEAGRLYPRCIAGRRARPPEDVGGTSGYAHFLAVLSNPRHPDHAEVLAWAGGEFDPERFQLDDVNAALALLVPIASR